MDVSVGAFVAEAVSNGAASIAGGFLSEAGVNIYNSIKGLFTGVKKPTSPH